jgi:hypothetical protein
MKPTINVLEEVNGVMQSVTREMTDEEYAEYMEAQRMAEEDGEA